MITRSSAVYGQPGVEAVKVRVKLFAALRKFSPTEGTDVVDLELPEGASAADAAAALGIPEGHSGAAFVNDERVELSVVLEDGQSIGLIPPLGGG